MKENVVNLRFEVFINFKNGNILYTDINVK